jgi:hypothetical protein
LGHNKLPPKLLLALAVQLLLVLPVTQDCDACKYQPILTTSSCSNPPTCTRRCQGGKLLIGGACLVMCPCMVMRAVRSPLCLRTWAPNWTHPSAVCSACIPGPTLPVPGLPHADESLCAMPRLLRQAPWFAVILQDALHMGAAIVLCVPPVLHCLLLFRGLAWILIRGSRCIPPPVLFSIWPGGCIAAAPCASPAAWLALIVAGCRWPYPTINPGRQSFTALGLPPFRLCSCASQ